MRRPLAAADYLWGAPDVQAREYKLVGAARERAGLTQVQLAKLL